MFALTVTSLEDSSWQKTYPPRTVYATIRHSRPTVENSAATNCFRYRSQRRSLFVVIVVVVVVSDFDVLTSRVGADFRFRFGNFRRSEDRLLSSAVFEDEAGDRKNPTCGPSTAIKRFRDSNSIAPSATASANASTRMRFSRPYVRFRRCRLRSFELRSPSLVSVSGFSTDATSSTSGDLPLRILTFAISGVSWQSRIKPDVHVAGARSLSFAANLVFSWFLRLAETAASTASTSDNKLLPVAISADNSIRLSTISASPSVLLTAIAQKSRLGCSVRSATGRRNSRNWAQIYASGLIGFDRFAEVTRRIIAVRNVFVPAGVVLCAIKPNDACSTTSIFYFPFLAHLFVDFF